MGQADEGRAGSSARPTTRRPSRISGASVDGRADQYALACVAMKPPSGSGAVPPRGACGCSTRTCTAAAAGDRGAGRPAGGDRPRAGQGAGEGAEHGSTAAATSPTRCGTRSAWSLTTRDAAQPGDVQRAIPSKPRSSRSPVPAQGGASTQFMSGPVTGTWTAVVSADRAYYDTLRAVNDQEATISFPAQLPERRFPLAGAEVRIGVVQRVPGHRDRPDRAAHRYGRVPAARQADRRPQPEQLVGRRPPGTGSRSTARTSPPARPCRCGMVTASTGAPGR